MGPVPEIQEVLLSGKSTMAIFAIGLLGIFLRRFEWPRPAFLIGFVLAYIFDAEQSGIILLVLAVMLVVASWIAIRHVDRQRLRNKLEHGAEFVLTQLFFDNDTYFEFHDYMTNTLGVSAPVTPGILPIVSVDQVKRFTAICGATLPAEVLSRLEAFGDDAEAVQAFGIDFATQQCEALLSGGAPGLHLYSLNRSPACLAILRNLGLAADSNDASPL